MSKDAEDTVVGAAAEDARDLPKVPHEQIPLVAEAIKEATSTLAYRLVVEADRVPGLTDTKLGGLPYWPRDHVYPTTSSGGKLMLLAQLNLADFGGDTRLPGSGLLQFFIDAEDDCSGMGFDDPVEQKGFRVVWHEHVDEGVTAEDVRALDVPTSQVGFSDDYIGNPVNGEFALRVEPTTWWMTIADGRADEVFCACCEKVMGAGFLAGRTDWFDLFDNAGYDALYEQLKLPEPSHVVLGCPFFTQYDPRSGALMDEFDTLLLQIDSEGEPGTGKDRVLWGDVGIGNFFINAAALRRGDFSRVLYNWDCY